MTKRVRISAEFAALLGIPADATEPVAAARVAELMGVSPPARAIGLRATSRSTTRRLLS